MEFVWALAGLAVGMIVEAVIGQAKDPRPEIHEDHATARYELAEKIMNEIKKDKHRGQA